MSRAQGIRKLLFLQLVIRPVTKSGSGTEIGILKRRAERERCGQAGWIDGFAQGISQDLEVVLRHRHDRFDQGKECFLFSY